MTGSRVSVVVSAIVAFSIAATAFAQSTSPASAPPRGLGPQSPSAEEAPPTPPPPQTSAPVVVIPPPGQQGLPPAPHQSVPPPQGPQQSQGSQISVTELAAIDPAGAGLVSASSGGFSSNLWAGSARTAVTSRLAQLPSAPNSPAMQQLTRRLLLTAATPPIGAAPPEEPSLLALRLSKLIANGLINDAATLAAQSPRDDSFARQAFAEALLLQAREADACGDGTALREQANDPYWLKLRALCHILQNDNQAALLTLDIMRERAVNDDVFFALAEALTEGRAVQVAALPAPSGIHLAMLRRANKPPPAAVAGWAPAATLLSQQAPNADLRLAAAERAAVAGILSAKELRDLYESETFTPDQLDDPEEAAKKLPTARANALFFQAMVKRTLPAGRATMFVAALQRADAQNRFALFAKLAAPIALQLKPSAETAWAAPHIARILLSNGNDKTAEGWLMAMTSPSDGPTVNALQIHLALVTPSVENLARMQGAMTWLGQNALKPGGAKDWLMDRATRETPLVNALGYIVPPDAQWAVSATTAGIVPSGAAAEALAAIDRSAEENKLGETILNALIALGAGGPTRAQGQTVTRVVKALNAVGLRDEARAIAIEAVLGAPIKNRA